VTKLQLNLAVHALLAASRRQTRLADPGDALFTIHMTAAVILSELAQAAQDIYAEVIDE